LGRGYRWGFGDCCRRKVLVSGMAGGGGPVTSGGARGARKSLTLGRLSRLKVETLECLQDYSEHQSKGHLIAPAVALPFWIAIDSQYP
jgi:hypothetical protein